MPLVWMLGLLLAVGPAGHSATNVIQEAGQRPAEGNSGKPPEFEVASIKPCDPKVMHMTGVTVYPGGRVVISCSTLSGLIATTFGLAYWQISGGDSWVERELYDLEAKPPENLQSSFTNLQSSWSEIRDERLRQMLQALLIDRFQLKFHRDSKTGTVYLLEKSGKPLMLRPTQAPHPKSDSPQTSGFDGNVGFASGRWAIVNCSMPQLVKFASDYIVHTPVIDQTGLTGWYDYRQPAPPSDEGADYRDNTDSFLRLIPELGLKLERTKGPVETFVIDHAEKPSPN